jgi:protein-S-isoprenylcysteine O-methyltransferase Ste14
VDLWFAKGAVIAAIVGLIAIRAPHGQRSRAVAVKRRAVGGVERALLTFAVASTLLPLVWLWRPVLSFADYPLHPVPYAAGLVLLAVSLWLFHRSHVDLGTNWSITLELREGHRLVTEGVYRRVRHPMYAALFLYSVALALVLPNWIVGTLYLVSFGLLFASRVRAEERLMREEFGADYDDYAARTKRLVPGVW